MGINSTYKLIYKKEGIDAGIVAKVFCDFALKKSITFSGEGYLTYEKWQNNNSLFGMAIIPLNVFDLKDWDGQSEWLLIMFSHIPHELFGWENNVVQQLGTFVEIHSVYDNVNEHSIEVLGNKDMDVSAAGIEWYVPEDYFGLLKYMSDKPSGDRFLIFRSTRITDYGY